MQTVGGADRIETQADWCGVHTLNPTAWHLRELRGSLACFLTCLTDQLGSLTLFTPRLLHVAWAGGAGGVQGLGTRCMGSAWVRILPLSLPRDIISGRTLDPDSFICKLVSIIMALSIGVAGGDQMR